VAVGEEQVQRVDAVSSGRRLSRRVAAGADLRADERVPQDVLRRAGHQERQGGDGRVYAADGCGFAERGQFGCKQGVGLGGGSPYS